MKSEILNLTKKFISIKSIAEHPSELKKILDLALEQLGEFKIEKFSHNGVESALIYNTKKRPKRFKILLNGHLDVIPGKGDSYNPVVRSNRIYGTGAMDMKANVACLIAVFKKIANKIDYPLGLQLVTDEEIGGFDGTKYQVERGVRADFVLAAEPTNFDIVNKAKGVLWLKISAEGKTAHGAYPWRGNNAIWKMHDVLTEIKKNFSVPDKQEWVSTVNLSNISTSNAAYNKIPDNCVIQLDIRYIPEESKIILGKIKKILNRKFKMEIVAFEPALMTEHSNFHIKMLEKSGKKITKKKIISREAQGTSDARHFMRVGCPGIEFGPIGGGIGSDKEWVDIRSLETYCAILEDFLLNI